MLYEVITVAAHAEFVLADVLTVVVDVEAIVAGRHVRCCGNRRRQPDDDECGVEQKASYNFV